MIRNEDDLDVWRRDVRAWLALSALRGAGLFDALSSGEGRTIGELADRLDVDARALELMARPIAARGLLVFDGERVSLSPAALRMQHAIAGLEGDGAEQADWTCPLRTGRPVRRTSGGVTPDDPVAAERFLAGLHRRSGESARISMRVVREACSGHNGPRILDLGGGHGAYAAAFAGIPGAKVTLFDRAAVLPIARKLSGQAFDTRAGDFLQDDLGGPYDVVFLSNVVHGEGMEGAARLFRRLREAVAPDGLVVAKDLFLDSSGVSPARAADFGMTMLMYTDAGRAYTVPEVSVLLTEAGFPEVRFVSFPSEGYGFVIGR